MSESMTVEQARADFETWISEPPFEACVSRNGPDLAFPGAYVALSTNLAWYSWQEAQAKMQARVAELEAEKWNAQIAEAALASVEQERDELRRWRLCCLVNYVVVTECLKALAQPTRQAMANAAPIVQAAESIRQG